MLELGGGVGGSTRAVLDGLADTPTDYLFTDVSRFFLDLAGTRFPGVRTALLDINSDLTAHGEQHDLVVAANVLHNAVDVQETLAGVRFLLAPGGVLALVESTREHLPALVSMQFLMSPRQGEPGAGSRDARAGTDRMFLTEQQWWAEFATAGLRPVAALPPAADPLEPLGQQLLVASSLTHGNEDLPASLRGGCGDAHIAAQRNLFNRLLGCLHHCLITGTPYDESTAFPTPTPQLEPAAA